MPEPVSWNASGFADGKNRRWLPSRCHQVGHIGLSNLTPAQIAEGRRIAEIVCVQNQYNLAHRADDARATARIIWLVPLVSGSSPPMM